MDETKKIKIGCGAAISGSITAVFVAAVTVIAELAPPIKNWLKATFSHHWVGKSILAAALFAGLTIIFALLPLRTDERKLTAALFVFAWLAILATLAIFGFFAYETL